MPIVRTAPHWSGSRKLAPDASGGRDPEGARHGAHHLGAIVVLEQDELDQPVARREQGEPGAAVRGRRQPRGIARQLGQDHLRGGRRRGRDRQQPVAPALRDHEPADPGRTRGRRARRARGRGRSARRSQGRSARPSRWRLSPSGRPPSPPARARPSRGQTKSVCGSAKASAVGQPMPSGGASVRPPSTTTRPSSSPAASVPSAASASEATGASKLATASGRRAAGAGSARTSAAAGEEEPRAVEDQIVRAPSASSTPRPRRARC